MISQELTLPTAAGARSALNQRPSVAMLAYLVSAILHIYFSIYQNMNELET
ncbi:MAG: hypothetical protein HWE11_09010 [Gammaproteobacteria bacterium]|nr:hypothetical protein [Gammaproteobacteria bacterium]